ncbi:MAG: hypothetical protein ACTH3E_03150 [Psychroflexus halocasei]
MKNSLLIALIFSSTIAFSQINVSKSKTENRWRVGGNIGLSFGSNDYFGFGISPSIGYKITEGLEGGLTVGYRYSDWKYSKQHMFNTGPYLNYYAIQNLFLRAHYEYYNGTQKNKLTSNSTSFDESALWLGAGYQSGGRVKIYFGLMYNVLYNDNESIFSNGLRPIGGVSVSL